MIETMFECNRRKDKTAIEFKTYEIEKVVHAYKCIEAAIDKYCGAEVDINPIDLTVENPVIEIVIKGKTFVSRYMKHVAQAVDLASDFHACQIDDDNIQIILVYDKVFHEVTYFEDEGEQYE
jgi:hypothetical protein